MTLENLLLMQEISGINLSDINMQCVYYYISREHVISYFCLMFLLEMLFVRPNYIYLYARSLIVTFV